MIAWTVNRTRPCGKYLAEISLGLTQCLTTNYDVLVNKPTRDRKVLDQFFVPSLVIIIITTTNIAIFVLMVIIIIIELKFYLLGHF